MSEQPAKTTTFPIDHAKLAQFAKDACEKAFEGKPQVYDHPLCKGWNDAIIGSMLGSMTSNCPPTSYKFLITSTIIQHDLKKEGKDGEPILTAPSRGMHTASGAFWNQDKDAIWSYKMMGAEGDIKREFDVVLTCAWVAV